MMKKVKNIRKNFIVGLLLIGLGIIFLLLILNMLSMTWLVFIISLGLILTYIYMEEVIYLIGGSVLLAISSVSLIDEYMFPSINIKIFIYLLVLGITLIYFFYKTRERNFLILSNIVLSLGFSNLIKQIAPVELPWIKFIFMALGFFLIYLLVYRVNGIVWPKYIAYILASIGFLYLFYLKVFYELNLIKLGYIISLIVILAGSRIVYTTIKEKRS